MEAPKKNKLWKDWQKQYLVDNYQTKLTEEIAEHIGKSEDAVLAKQYLLGLKPDTVFLHELRNTGKGAIARKRLFREWDGANDWTQRKTESPILLKLTS